MNSSLLDEKFEEYKEKIKKNIKNYNQEDRIELLLWLIIRKLFILDGFRHRAEDIKDIS